MLRQSGFSIKQQKGAVLLVAMVLLLVVTFLGVSTIGSTTMELKMATNNQQRQHVFQAAEAALAAAEKKLQTSGVSNTQIMDCVSGSAVCFEDTCEGGLCFNGSYTATDTPYTCALDSSTPPSEKPWRDGSLDVFNSAGKHLKINVNGLSQDVKYIVEFLCFIEKDNISSFDSFNQYNGAPLLRFTALAISDTGDVQVALQSTYRYND